MDQYRVYGNPISQSKSPQIHQSFASQTEQVINYQSELVAVDEFEQTVRQFMADGGKGANVTVPFKEEAMAICDELTSRAKLAGAVNTLSFKAGKILGDNTDGLGLVNDLLNHQVTLANKRILLLGAGGAAKGVILPLLEQKPTSITIANRTVSKAEALASKFNNKRINACGFSQTAGQNFDVIINATSASLSGDPLPIPPSVITTDSICYDMVYSSEATAFNSAAINNGAKQTIDGLGMLVGQAAESFTLWRGVAPETTQVYQQLKRALMASNPE